MRRERERGRRGGGLFSALTWGVSPATHAHSLPPSSHPLSWPNLAPPTCTSAGVSPYLDCLHPVSHVPIISLSPTSPPMQKKSILLGVEGEGQIPPTLLAGCIAARMGGPTAVKYSELLSFFRLCHSSRCRRGYWHLGSLSANG